MLGVLAQAELLDFGDISFQSIGLCLLPQCSKYLLRSLQIEDGIVAPAPTWEG